MLKICFNSDLGPVSVIRDGEERFNRNKGRAPADEKKRPREGDFKRKRENTY